MTPDPIVLAAHDPGGDGVGPLEVVQRRPLALLDLHQHGEQVRRKLYDPTQRRR